MYGEPHHLTVYSDLHSDSASANHKLIKEHMDRRADMQNAHFVGIGDIGNYVMPRDLRRFKASEPRKELQGIDDYIDKAVDLQIEELGAYPWRMLGMGNHCQSVLDHHLTNPMARLCRKLGVRFGGFSGFLRIRFRRRTPTKKVAVVGNVLTILYHHGAWGGRVIKGFGGARDYARHFEGWDVFCYGHNHQLTVHHEPMIGLDQNGNITKRSVYYCNTGTFLESYEHGRTTYGEVRGYPPVVLSAPLIRVVPHKNNKVEVAIVTGDV